MAGHTPLEAAVVGALQAYGHSTPRTRTRPASEKIILEADDETVIVDVDDIDS